MQFTDLNPRWFNHGGPGHWRADGSEIPLQRGVGVHFDCPCGCGDTLAVSFKTDLDGKPYRPTGWDRTGTTFETLTVHPSVRVVGRCGWHGWIRNGKVTTC